MSYVFCNRCGHRNPPSANFCSSCGAQLDTLDDRTLTIANVDPLQDSPGPHDDAVVNLGSLPTDVPSLIVRAGAQAGASFPLLDAVTRLGRHPDNEIMLDDITVSRRHADIRRTTDGYVVDDAGSLNGTYVNQDRIDAPTKLVHGDELQVGKFRLVFFERAG